MAGTTCDGKQTSTLTSLFCVHVLLPDGQQHPHDLLFYTAIHLTNFAAVIVELVAVHQGVLLQHVFDHNLAIPSA